jgi:PhnB protein
MSTINPYIGFNGKCREAMTFYKSCFGGELELLQVGGSPMEEHIPGPPEQIYHSHLRSGQIVLMGTDFSGSAGHVMGNNMSIAIACSSEDDAHSFFSKLSEGGEVTMPLEKTFWADLFGSVKDKYGIAWMLNYDKVPQ